MSKKTKNKYVGKKMSLATEIKKNWFFYVIPIPGIICLILFSYIPMAGIYMAFERYNYKTGIFGSPFVGLDNFRMFFANMDAALRATRNTVVMNALGITCGMFVNVAVAIMLGEVLSEKFRKIVQTITLFPHFLSWIVIGTLSDVILNNEGGLLNKLIIALGGEKIMWTMEPQYWWWIILLFSLWKGFGYGSIVYYATLTGFDPSLYEAAKIDGASRMQQVTKITVPLLRPTMVTLFLLSIGGILGSSLEQIMGMTKMNPFLLETTDTIATYVFRTTTQLGQFGIASAVSVYTSVFGCILVLSANLIAKKIDPDYGLF